MVITDVQYWIEQPTCTSKGHWFLRYKFYFDFTKQSHVGEFYQYHV